MDTSSELKGKSIHDDLGPHFKETVLSATGAGDLRVEAALQELWSGYGRILRLQLDGAEIDTVVAKHVRPPTRVAHPRGWHGSQSHDRKAKSYDVETSWYRDWSHRCDDRCRLPRFLAFARHDDEILLVLEDLDAAGFPVRRQHVTRSQIDACLEWLANFHATFMGATPDGLWQVGSYWHLDTRGEELEALDDPALKDAAPAIDRMLRQARFQTLVHGDAKLANFCFPVADGSVAAVDFQYVGGGCGMKDLAYFIGSCLDEGECERQESSLLDRYFGFFRESLAGHHPTIDADAVEEEWRSLFPVAWTDFHRFLKGWSPGHWKINSYSERIAREIVRSLP